ncbi:unnamed protein product [Closterium sp. Naga37s-1]|nr:unnamed protein product [Closterium sp. Naga37s-1]
MHIVPFTQARRPFPSTTIHETDRPVRRTSLPDLSRGRVFRVDSYGTAISPHPFSPVRAVQRAILVDREDAQRQYLEQRPPSRMCYEGAVGSAAHTGARLYKSQSCLLPPCRPSPCVHPRCCHRCAWARKQVVQAAVAEVYSEESAEGGHATHAHNAVRDERKRADRGEWGREFARGGDDTFPFIPLLCAAPPSPLQILAYLSSTLDPLLAVPPASPTTPLAAPAHGAPSHPLSHAQPAGLAGRLEQSRQQLLGVEPGCLQSGAARAAAVRLQQRVIDAVASSAANIKTFIHLSLGDDASNTDADAVTRVREEVRGVREREAAITRVLLATANTRATLAQEHVRVTKDLLAVLHLKTLQQHPLDGRRCKLLEASAALLQCKEEAVEQQIRAATYTRDTVLALQHMRSHLLARKAEVSMARDQALSSPLCSFQFASPFLSTSSPSAPPPSAPSPSALPLSASALFSSDPSPLAPSPSAPSPSAPSPSAPSPSAPFPSLCPFSLCPFPLCPFPLCPFSLYPSTPSPSLPPLPILPLPLPPLSLPPLPILYFFPFPLWPFRLCPFPSASSLAASVCAWSSSPPTKNSLLLRVNTTEPRRYGREYNRTKEVRP